MEGSAELSILAEVLVALAGFTGIVVAIRGRVNAHPWDNYRAVSLLVTALGALILSLFPFVLHTFAVAGPSLWRASSAACIVVGIGPVVPMVRYMPDGYQTSRFFRLVSAAGIGGLTISLILSVFNALAILTEGTLSLFYLSVAIAIPNIAVQLVVILVAPPQE